MSRRSNPTAQLLVKVGCTGRGQHKRLVFDTVELSMSVDTLGVPYVAVRHNAGKFKHSNETQVPSSDDSTLFQRSLVDPNAEFANIVYLCPLCKRNFEIRVENEAQVFGKALDLDRVSFLDLSEPPAIT